MMNDGSREFIHPYSMREREGGRERWKETKGKRETRGERERWKETKRERERERGEIESQYVVEEGKDHKPEFHAKYCRR